MKWRQAVVPSSSIGLVIAVAVLMCALILLGLLSVNAQQSAPLSPLTGSKSAPQPATVEDPVTNGATGAWAPGEAPQGIERLARFSR